MYISSSVLAPPLPSSWAPARPRLIPSHRGLTDKTGQEIQIQLLLGRNFFRRALPLVSEGFFGRSENPFPSILSFFSAALDVEVSIANVSERERTQKELLTSDDSSTLGGPRWGKEVLIWDEYTQESLETLSGSTESTVDVPARERSWKGSSGALSVMWAR